MLPRILSTCFLLGIVVHHSEAVRRKLQNSTICSPNGARLCSRVNRVCEISKEGEEDCGQCQPGYIDFVDYNSDSRYLLCVEIAKITWPDYVKGYEPFYDGIDLASYRIGLLKDSAEYSAESNAKNRDFTLGLTPFSADRPIEYQKRSGYFDVDTSGTKDELPVFVAPTVANADILPSVDWVTDGAVTPVIDQGRCACSWAIGVCGAIEGAAFYSRISIDSLSFQQFISCNKRNLGCDGGSTPIGARYAAENWFGGVATLEDYPFTDASGSTSDECKLTGETPPPALNVTNPVIVAGLEAPITFDKRLETFKLALMNKSISVILKSSCRLFSNYVSGVLTDDDGCQCSDSKCYDHSVLMVGYNDTAETPYFKFKNSWGTRWGEAGYFRVSQQESGAYGLFGIFGEGVMVDVEPNLELDGKELENSSFLLPIWAIITIAVVGSFCCLCCGYICCVCWKRKK